MERAEQTRINDKIRITPVRVVSSDGEQLGVIPTEEALEKARDAGLDLVEVAPNERPPVCRIMDYGKYKYEKNKKANKSTGHQTKTKEIRLATEDRTARHRFQGEEGGRLSCRSRQSADLGCISRS